MTDRAIAAGIILVEYAIVLSLLILAGIVLVRTFIAFFDNWSGFPATVIGAIDGILVVIILLDIVHTVFRHMRSKIFPVKPFLVIGILAGVREILSASAHLTLSEHLSNTSFYETLAALGVAVGIVIFLLGGLVLLKFSGYTEEGED